MAQTPGPQFVDIVNNYLLTYIKPRSFDNGRYADSRAPITPDQFNARLKEEAQSYAPNNWEVGKDLDSVILGATMLYAAAYKGWVNRPLAGDAPPEVVAWQTQARAAQ